MHILSANNVHKTYTQAGVTNQVLQGVTHAFKTACSYAISGVSGTGKSTLLHILAGIDQPTNGQVFYDGIDLEKMTSTDKVRFLRHEIGLVFQDAHLIKELSVIENVMLKDLIAGTVNHESLDKAKQLLDLVGLADKADHHPLSLSGGQQQRLAVLRALFNKPTFLLADEPTGNLDADNARAVINVLNQAVAWGMGLIVCSHDPAVAGAMQKRLVLEHGTLVEYT